MAKCDRCGAGNGVAKGEVKQWEAFRMLESRDKDARMPFDLHVGCVGGWLLADGKEWAICYAGSR